jgi:hypothetical protein
MHSGVFSVRNIDTLFSCSGGTGTDLTTSTGGHVMSTMCFCMQWDLWVTEWILVRSGCELSMQYFSFSGGTSTDLANPMPGQIAPN